MPKSSLLTAALATSALAIAVLAAAPEAQAQRVGTLGIGGQIGEPSGVTLRAYRSTGTRLDRAFDVSGFDLTAGWNLDERFHLDAALFHERPVGDGTLQLYYGPGAFLDVGTRAHVGLLAAVGIAGFLDRFQLYAQLTPRLALLPDTRGDLDGGIGIRYFIGARRR